MTLAQWLRALSILLLVGAYGVCVFGFFVYFFKTRSHYVAPALLELTT